MPRLRRVGGVLEQASNGLLYYLCHGMVLAAVVLGAGRRARRLAGMKAAILGWTLVNGGQHFATQLEWISKKKKTTQLFLLCGTLDPTVLPATVIANCSSKCGAALADILFL